MRPAMPCVTNASLVIIEHGLSNRCSVAPSLPPGRRLISGGEHPPHGTVMGMAECAASPAPSWEGRRGAEAALVGRGTTVPLSRIKPKPFPCGLGQAMATMPP